MPGFTFVHCADVHLDTPMKARSADIRRRLRQVLRDSFSRVVDLCIEHDARFLLVAGDLFDTDTVSLSTQDFLVHELGRLGSVPVFIAPGNHDPFRRGETYARMALPPHVYVFRSARPEQQVVCDTDGQAVAVVHGVGHTKKNLSTNLVASIAAAEDGLFHAACLHACVESSNAAGEHEGYAPCGTDDFTERGVHYWALGHIHRRQVVRESPWAVYPGNTQGRDFGETGAKGCYVVAVGADRQATPTFVETSGVRWHRLELDIAGLADVAQAGQALRERWDAVSADVPGEWCLRVGLVGRGVLDPELTAVDHDPEAREELVAQWQDALGVLLLELDVATAPPVDLDAMADEQNIRGDFIRSVREFAQDPEARAALAGELAWACPGWPRLSAQQQDRYLIARLEEALIEGVVRLSPPEDLVP